MTTDTGPFLTLVKRPAPTGEDVFTALVETIADLRSRVAALERTVADATTAVAVLNRVAQEAGDRAEDAPAPPRHLKVIK